MENVEDILLKCCDIENNKYFKWYIKIIKSRISNKLNREEVYCEKHHIVPKCMKANIEDTVLLTAREHFIVHLLLPKFIHDVNAKKKLVFALWGLCTQHTEDQKRITINSRTYSVIKKTFSDSISGDNHWMKDPERRRKMSEFRKGWKMSEEQKKKLSDRFKGRKLLWGDKISVANKGKKRTEEMNKAQSLRIKNEYKIGTRKPNRGVKQKKVQCKYCLEYANYGNIVKWHNENSNCVLRKEKREHVISERIKRHGKRRGKGIKKYTYKH